jgi:hypothetical protein
MTVEDVLGANIGAFVGLTLVLFGAAAASTGRTLAHHWRSVWQGIVYGLLLTVGDRFLSSTLFNGALLSASGFAVSFLYLAGMALLARRIALARLMVRQYPWMYEPAGLFGWRERERA